MAARKLQTEIDRTLKKVGEGVELFENIYDKMQATANLSQKEKLELDLKTQIKKLQRLRDQIKTWVAGNEIKDKSALVENRRLIETQMERFKACEKEMKTKAYSKAGLTQATILDPKEQEKEEAAAWLRTQVEELQMQVETAEAEIEALQGTGKKRNKSSSVAAGRQEELEHLNDRRKWHIGRLEIVLRLVENGTLSTDRVNSLKDDVAYFVESNANEDFDEDDGIYDELNLDEEDAKFGNAVEEDDESGESDRVSEDIPPRTPLKKHEREKDEESVSSSKRDESPILKKANQSLQLRKSSVDASKPPPNPNFAQQPMSSILKAGLPASTPRGPAPLPPIRYAAAAAAAVSPSPAAQPLAQHPSPVVTTATMTATTSTAVSTPPASITAHTPQPSISDHMSHVTSSPSLTHPSLTSPMLSSAASVSQQPDGSFYSGQESPAVSEAVAVSPAVSKAPSSPAKQPEPIVVVLKPVDGPSAASVPAQAASTALQPGPSPLPQQIQQFATNAAASSSTAPPTQQQPIVPPSAKSAVGDAAQVRPPSAAPPAASTQRPLASLTDLVSSFESVKQKAHNRTNMANLDQVNKLLEGGYNGIPQPQDTEKAKYYIPRNPYQSPHYYPQVPNPLLSTPAIFSQLDIETLFYVFYYLPGTFSQYLAAKELKRQSWRFHVKYLTWFQRHSEPQAITEEYEQGVYVYFDWEGSWCQRKKSDFRFEYRYLSEE